MGESAAGSEGGLADVVPVLEALLEGPVSGRRLLRAAGVSRGRAERAVAVLVSRGFVEMVSDGGGEVVVGYSSPEAREVVRDFMEGRGPRGGLEAPSDEAVRAVLNMLRVLVDVRESVGRGEESEGTTS